MGYTLTIGEATLHFVPEDQYLRIEAQRATQPGAPNHDRFTGNGNSRSPSYTGWKEFCEEAGISELFYGGGWDREARGYRECSENYHRSTPLLAEHPGSQPLCDGDLKEVRAARMHREKNNGGREPGFWDYDKETHQDIPNDKDSTLARLLWLEFWIAWALENCRIPILQNT